MEIVTPGSMCCTNFVNRNAVSPLPRNIAILMLGLDNVGKTSAAKSLVGEPVDLVAPTVGFSKFSTRYKSFKVSIFDLGGSKGFRSIWPKYYHEVHAFIFVVDASSDKERMNETSQTFKTILDHPKVRGKPMLVLCNKADLDEAQDELHIVDELKIERLVNVAKCPTRVELSVASKNQGLKDGFKWLIRSVISSLPELGARIDADVEEERKIDEIRREEVRRKIEERRKMEGNDAEEGEQSAPEHQIPPGFIPISRFKESKSKTDKIGPSRNKDCSTTDKVANGIAEGSALKSSRDASASSDRSQNGREPKIEVNAKGSSATLRKGSNGSARTSFAGDRTDAISATVNGHKKLNLEPVHQAKKKSILKNFGFEET